MQLTIDLQKQLNQLNADVQLATTIDGTIPTEYAFMKGEGRQFRAQFASNPTEFSVILFERIPNLSYENCFARAVIKDLSKLARLIDLWVNKQADIEKLSSEFTELELFKPFSFKHDNPEIEAAWIKVKNMTFGEVQFWEKSDWHKRYETMLNEAKKYKSFENYFPLTSHYNLRFSIDKDFKETWEFYYSIVPSFDKSKGNYCVEVSIKHDEAKYFGDINKALDFYADLLKKVKPTKWR